MKAHTALPGYQILEELFSGQKSQIYRAIRDTDKQPVILKILKDEHPDQETLKRFEFEYHIFDKRPISGAPQVLALETLGHRRVMVMEDNQAVAVAQLLKDGPLPLSEILDIAIKVTNIVGTLHAAGIIHKDLNPANIIRNPHTGEVKVIDFGLAALTRRETQSAVNPERLEGTLPYLSPEQTGRMNRSIDYRSDFYALGATFYCMLTGRPPFETRDPLELVHSHIARVPIPPLDIVVRADLRVRPEGRHADVEGEGTHAGVPLRILSDIIMKLLAKNAEDRYQSAAGLKYDLEYCHAHLADQTEMPDFTPGTRDISERFQIPEKLYGREQEISTLMAAFERTASGGKELLLLAGHPGIGKSALIQELQKPLTAANGLFLQGKFDRLNRSTPYLAFTQAFEQLCRQLLAEPEERLIAWKQRILEAVGENGRVLTDVIPTLELVIGVQPEVETLPPTESQNRFTMAFQSFLKTIATRENPLALFLDDVQWADHASLELVQRLWQDPELTHILLLGAYRDNEIDASHPLSLMLERFRQADVRWETIALTPLTVSHLTQMLSDTLMREPSEAESLATLLVKKTEGNPFFAREFLTTLYTQGLLTFREGWQWELQRIEDAGITENVVELMAAKINTLSPATTDLLKAACCIGSRFDLALLKLVHGAEEKALQESLQEALNEGILLQYGPSLQFVHDRVHEAAYSLLQDDEREHLHYRIGKMLLERQDDLDAIIFQVAAHLNRAERLLTETEKATLLDINLQAGLKAKLSGAYDTAADFLEYNAQLLPEDCWESDYDRALNLYTELAEAAFLALRTERAETLFHLVLHHARRTLDDVKIRALQISHHCNHREYLEALAIGRAVLEQFGVHIPEAPEQAAIGQALTEMAEQFGQTTFDELLKQAEMCDPETLATIDILMSCFPPAIITNPNVMILIIVKILQLSLQHGNTPSTAYASLIYSFFIAGRDMGEASGYAQHALRLSERFGQKTIQGKVLFSFGASCVKYKDSLQLAPSLLHQAIEFCKDAGDVQYLGYCYFNIGLNAFLSGERLELVRRDFYEKYASALSRLQQPQNTLYFHVWRQLIETLQGHTAHPTRLFGEFFSEEDELPNMKAGGDMMGVGYALLGKIILSFLHETPEATHALIEETAAYVPAIASTSVCFNTYCFFQAMTLASRYSDTDADAQPAMLEKLQGLQAMFEGWSRHNPHIFLHEFHLISAEIARISATPMEKVVELYELAISGAKQHRVLYEEAIANERAAGYFLSKRLERLAGPYLQEARYCYHAWGCMPKVKQLDETHPGLLAGGRRAKGSHAATTLESGTAENSFVDMQTVIKASRAISGEIKLERLLARIMEIIIENAGAQHGCLILAHGSELTVDASVTVEHDGVQVAAATPLTGSPLASEAIVRYVFRSGDAIVLRHAAQDGAFTNDMHIQRHQSKSVLCLPMRLPDRILGVLYLENNLTVGAFTEARIELLNILLPQMAISLENARLVENMREQERLQKEMELARQIQTAILPKRIEHPDFEIEAAMLPAEEVGGDYYDGLIGKDGNLWLGIGDVSGHGMTPGLIMMMAQTVHTTITTQSDVSPREVIVGLNNVLYCNVRDRLNSDHFMTFTTLRYLGEGRFQHAGAHLTMLLYRQARGVCEQIDTKGAFLNFVPDISHATKNDEFTMEIGDTLVLYTDGLTEAHKPGGKILDIHRFTEIVERHAAKTPDAMRDAILEDVLAWSDQHRLDDMTLMIVRRTA